MPFARPLLLALALLLAACTGKDGLDQPPPPLGDFRLGHNIVVGKTGQMVPPSRSATPEQWEAALTKAIDERFGRYTGEGLYHMGVSVDAYALAIPGIPVVVKPKSILVVSATVWDNSTQQKLNGEVKQFSVFEGLGLSGESLVGSGLTQNKQKQMENLSRSAALAIQRWLVENADWFSPDPAVRAAARAATVDTSGKERPRQERDEDK